MANDIKVGITATGQAEIGKQLTDTANKVNQTSSGMSTIVQKANQYFQQLTQSKNQQEQKDQQHHRKELERIQKEIEARKILLAETEGSPATTSQAQAKRTIQVQQEQRHIEQLERQASTPYAAPTRQMPSGVRSLGRKTMGVAGTVAGLMGAYSLFSKIGGGMGAEDQAATGLAKSMLTMPSGGAGFGEVRKMLTEELSILGDTALITAKDMGAMVSALRETGDMSKDSRETQIKIANEAKRMNMDPSIAGELQQNMLRFGGIGSSGDYLQMQRRIGGRSGMSHRVEEMMRTQSEAMMALSHGATMTGGATIENILGLLDTSGMKMYSGARGGKFLQSLDQAFRSGGNEQFEQFQYMALSPMRQGRGVSVGGYGSGLSDAYIADWMQEQGAFGTRSGMMEQAARLGMPQMSKYIGKSFTGEQTNLERVMSEVKKGLGIGMSEKDRLRFASTFGGKGGMLEGASATDILALEKIFSDGGQRRAFLQVAQESGLKGKDIAGLAPIFGDKSAVTKFLGEKRDTTAIFDEIGKNLNKVIEENRKSINEALKQFGTGVDGLSKFMVKGTKTMNKILEFLDKDNPLAGMSPELKKDFLSSISKQTEAYRTSEEGMAANAIAAQYLVYGDVRMFGMGKESKAWGRSAYERTRLSLEQKGHADSGAPFDTGSYILAPFTRAANEATEGLIKMKKNAENVWGGMQQRQTPYFIKVD